MKAGERPPSPFYAHSKLQPHRNIGALLVRVERQLWCDYPVPYNKNGYWRKAMKTLIAVTLGFLASGTALAQGAKIVSFKGAVSRTGPCGDPQKPLGINSMLGNSCQLTSKDPNSNVQIECRNGATLQLLSGGFNAIILRDGDPDCVLELPLGSAMATSSGQQEKPGSATIKTGALAAVVTGTSVVVTVPASGAANATAFVLEGEAEVTRAGVMSKLAAGTMTYAKSTAIVNTPSDRVRWVANDLAIASTTGAGVQVSPAQQAALSNHFFAVYTEPKNAAARTKLTQSLDAVHAPENSFRRYQSTQAFKLNQATVHVGPGPTPQQLAVTPGAMVAHPLPRTFDNPTFNGRRVDICLRWGVDCGKPAADAFCRANSYSASVDYSIAQDIGGQTPTVVMGENKVCSEASCDGFSAIRCQ